MVSIKSLTYFKCYVSVNVSYSFFCVYSEICLCLLLFSNLLSRGCLIKKILGYQKLLLNHLGNKLRENCGNGKTLEKTITTLISKFPIDRFLASATNRNLAVGSNFLFLVDLKYKQQTVLAEVIITKCHSPSDPNSRRLLLQCWRFGSPWYQQVWLLVQALFMTCTRLPSCYVLIQWREVLTSLPFLFSLKCTNPVPGAAPL